MTLRPVWVATHGFDVDVEVEVKVKVKVKVKISFKHPSYSPLNITYFDIPLFFITHN